MSYKQKLKDPRWQKLRLKVFERDGFTCFDCDSEDKTLTVHHCYYEKGDPWDTDIAYLMTLCEDCHKTRQELEEDIRASIGLNLTTKPISRVKQIAADVSMADAKGLDILIHSTP